MGFFKSKEQKNYERELENLKDMIRNNPILLDTAIEVSKEKLCEEIESKRGSLEHCKCDKCGLIHYKPREVD